MVVYIVSMDNSGPASTLLSLSKYYLQQSKQQTCEAPPVGGFGEDCHEDSQKKHQDGHHYAHYSACVELHACHK